MALDDRYPEDQPTRPESFDSKKYSNLFLSACENGHSNLLKFLFAEELFGKKTMLKSMSKWFYDDLCGLIWSFVTIPFDVNTTNARGVTGLMLAAKNDQIEIMKILLKIPKIDLNLQDKTGFSALHHASRRQKWRVVELLLKEPSLNVNLRDESGWTSLMFASRQGKMVDEFLTRSEIDVNVMNNERDLTALILGSKHGRGEAVESLLYHETLDLSALMNSGQTQYEDALLHAYEKKNEEVISILELDDLEEDSLDMEEHYI